MWQGIGRIIQRVWTFFVAQLDPSRLPTPARDPGNIQGHLTGVVWMVIFLIVVAILGGLSESIRPDEFIVWLVGRIINAVTLEHLYAAIWTMVASIVAFFIAVNVGYFLGVIAAVLSRSYSTKFRIIGNGLYTIADALYVIPLVATMALVIAALHDFPKWFLLICAVAIAAIALGGYQVFETIYRSAILPKQSDRLLADALFSSEHPTSFIGRVRREFSTVRRLLDFSIRDYVNAVRRAFHLSVVAVVTLECVRPGLYEFLVPSEGIAEARYGGIGYVMLNAQALASWPLIFGMILLIVVFDAIAVSFIGSWLRRKYLRHYEEQTA